LREIVPPLICLHPCTDAGAIQVPEPSASLISTVAMRLAQPGSRDLLNINQTLSWNGQSERAVMPDQPVVRLEKDGDIGVIIVNIRRSMRIGPGVAEGIIECLSTANADPSIKALMLIGDGRSFIAGANIRGFDANRRRLPIGERTYDIMDRSPKPIVAAIHGHAFGGGLENAMSCHYRIAVRSAKVGLPEVLIGILPGGGGTQRLPRLACIPTALGMIVSGRHVPDPEEKRLGILDEIPPEGADLR
jgi:3-hydroxyacyl-CoA dehydrogenase